MFFKLASLSAALLLASTAANAYTIVDTHQLAGTVTAVNAQAHELTVFDSNDQEKIVKLSPTAQAIMGSKRANALASIEVGHSISWRQQVLTTSFDELSGEIKSVDRNNGLLEIKLDNSDRVTIQLDPAAVISNVERKAINFEDLRPSYKVTIKASRKFSEMASAQSI